VRVDSGGGVGEKLVDGVDAMGQDAGALVKLEGWDEFVGGFFGGDGAFVAITEGVAERGGVGTEADVVDAPAIDGDGGYAFGNGCRGFAEAFFEAGEDGLEWPVHRCALVDWAVGDAMDDFDGGSFAIPAEEGDSAGFGA